MTEQLVEPGLDARRDGALETHRLVVRFGPAEPDDRGQQPLEERVTAEDAVRGRPTGRRQVQVAALGVGDETVGDEPPEHLAGGLRGHPEVARDLGGRDAAGVVGPDEDAQGEEVFLGGGGQVALVVTTGRHALRIRDGSAARARGPGWRPRWRCRPARRASRTAPRARPARVAVGGVAGGRQDEGGRDRGRRAGRSSPSPRSRRRREQQQDREDSRPGAARTNGSASAVAGRGEPAAAGHLADEPGDPEGDRQPADDGPDDPAAPAPEARRR